MDNSHLPEVSGGAPSARTFFSVSNVSSRNLRGNKGIGVHDVLMRAAAQPADMTLASVMGSAATSRDVGADLDTVAPAAPQVEPPAL